MPHHVHSARPDSITCAACLTKASAWPTGDVDPHVAAVVVDELAVLVDLADLLELEQDLVVRAVVAEPDRPEHEHRLDGSGQFHRSGDRAILGRRQVGQHLGEVLRDRSGLLLLALDRDPRAFGADLEEERPFARAAHGPDRELVDVVELVEDAHVSVTDRCLTRDAVR